MRAAARTFTFSLKLAWAKTWKTTTPADAILYTPLHTVVDLSGVLASTPICPMVQPLAAGAVDFVRFKLIGITQERQELFGRND